MVYVEKLKRHYDYWDDVDLFVGGILEKPPEDGLIGRTIDTMIAEQFFRLKNMDRFFYEMGQVGLGEGRETLRFTLQQLNEIKKTSMARILCDNLRHEPKTYKLMQPQAFLVESENNRKKSCMNIKEIPAVDLLVFRDNI